MDNDVFIATAAVADWRPVAFSEHKIKKNQDARAPVLALTENPDILAAVAQLKKPFCVGFAAAPCALKSLQVPPGWDVERAIGLPSSQGLES